MKTEISHSLKEGLPYLKEIRNQRNLEQKHLAEKLEVTSGTISRWECGESTPSLKHCCLLADELNVSLDYITGRTNTFNPNEMILKNMMIYFRLMSKSDLDIIEAMARLLAIRSSDVKKKARITADAT